MALLLRDRGDHAHAEPLFRCALESSERVLGKEHPHTQSSVSGLGSVLSSQGDYARAEPLLRRALEVRERVLGNGHRETLSSVRDLALLMKIGTITYRQSHSTAVRLKDSP